MWHRFPKGVTCVTAMRPHDCDDQTTVEQRRVAWPTVTVGTSGGFYMMVYKLTLYLIWAFMELPLTIFLLPCFSPRVLEPPKG